MCAAESPSRNAGSLSAYGGGTALAVMLLPSTRAAAGDPRGTRAGDVQLHERGSPGPAAHGATALAHPSGRASSRWSTSLRTRGGPALIRVSKPSHHQCLFPGDPGRKWSIVVRQATARVVTPDHENDILWLRSGPCIVDGVGAPPSSCGDAHSLTPDWLASRRRIRVAGECGRADRSRRRPGDWWPFD